LAAAMQDYDRALIVGSMSTYGKGTVQTIVNLDDYVNGGSEIKPLGQIKLTTQKYYRINGDATQLKGVIPDVILPDEYNKIKVGEKDYEHSMAWDKIEAVNYKTWDQPVSPQLDELRRRSSQRVQASATFSLIAENADRFKARREREEFPLSLKAFQSDVAAQKKESDRFRDIRKTIEGMDVSFLSADMDYIYADETRTQRFETWQKNLRKDIHLYETIQIMQDMK
ncbi:MAG: carboxy terminal-processing peptidase, partial [Bacteroidota bacterium]